MNLNDEENKPSCCKKEGEGNIGVKDPICGMDVNENNTSLRYGYKGSNYYFCSERCLQAFKNNPEGYLAGPEAKPATTRKDSGKNRATMIGALGGLSLLIIFFSIVTMANGSFDSALYEFRRIWYWLLILASGFGFQLGLFTHLKYSVREKMSGATAEVAASGTISAGSMIACCSHALVNVLPILGVSAIAAFLAQYQMPFILIGVFSNLIGITIMLGIVQKHGLLPRNAMGHFVAGHNMKTIRNGMIGVGIIVVALSFLATAARSAPPVDKSKQSPVIVLKTLTDSQNAVTVEVQPSKFRFGEPIRFEVTLNTHSVDLDFELIDIAKLVEDNGNVGRPLSWDGSPSGGHHRSGILTFPAIDSDVKSLKLVLENIGGVPERIFSWELTGK